MPQEKAEHNGWIPIPEHAAEPYHEQITECNKRLEDGEIVRLETTYELKGRQTTLTVQDGELLYCPVVDGKRRMIRHTKNELHSHATGISMTVAFAEQLVTVEHTPGYLT